MNRNVFVHSTVMGVLLAVAVAPSGASASTAAEFLNAPVWYLQYEVSFKAAHKGTYNNGYGPISFTSSLERVFSAAEPLNLRSQGPGAFSMTAMYAGSEGKTPTAAEAQAISMKMLSQMETTANWMAGGVGLDENATDAEITASMQPSSPVRLEYTRVDTGKDLTDEYGGKFDSKVTKTIKGTGVVQTGGMGGVIFEMDTSSNSFVLTLPFVFNAQSAAAKSETVSFVQPKGAAGQETRETSDVPFDLFPSDLALEDPKQGFQNGGVTIRAAFDPAKGLISGEQSFNGRYAEANEPVPGTFVFKYTLTMTPPKK